MMAWKKEKMVEKKIRNEGKRNNGVILCGTRREEKEKSGGKACKGQERNADKGNEKKNGKYGNGEKIKR